MNKNDLYKPIACSLHDEYEVAIMQKKSLNIRWRDDSGMSYRDEIMPEDIVVKDRQEFLVAKTKAGNILTIRLDKISFV